jgi:hypothetical protein
MAARAGSPVIGTAELFENDRVKIWDFVLEAGEAMPLHTHRRDHVIVVVEGGRLEVRDAEGRCRTLEPRAGDWYYGAVAGEDTHDARNVGTTRYRNLIIELKAGRP